MFTGIVERMLKVIASDGGKVRIQHPWTDIGLGQSVAINGCCLTVARKGEKWVEFDVIAETLSKTNLGRIGAGDLVNAERSLRVGDRLDGHFVQGHIDATATILEAIRNQKETRLVIQTPEHLANYIVTKGSVALDGVSLTVAAVSKGRFEVALIPTTLELTNLGKVGAGWPLNLETDILNRTIVAWLENRKE